MKASKRRKAKPAAKRPQLKPPARRRDDDDTYTTSALMERYNNTQRTIRRFMREMGFPHPVRPGREYVYSARAVHAWELIHMPHLHPQIRHEDDERYNDMRAVMRGEEAAARLAGRNKADAR